MVLKNCRTRLFLTVDLKRGNGWADKLLGMLLKRNKTGILFNTRFGIHTIGLKQPIDVLVVDNFRVVKVKTVKPNNLFFWNPRYSKVIELPESAVSKTGTRIGDKVKIF